MGKGALGLDGPIFFLNHSNRANVTFVVGNGKLKSQYKCKAIYDIEVGEQLYLNYGIGYFAADELVEDLW
jgi:SET domain-containing protein